MAKVSLASRSFKASIHEKYFETDSVKRNSLVLSYISLDRNNSSNFSKDIVARWVSVASGSADGKDYAGAEKSFVEKLVDANPNVIDLEMALPGLAGEPRSAVRMDLVALEPNGDGWNVVFWEGRWSIIPKRAPRVIRTRR